ncbi:N-acetylmuramoyl-L-alanine amidase [Fictibacillus nanhaiensis]|uniref:peptidoglycan recognition protein family protein n=1 Tax=Fictibacillus nanhaiensis TaxID=742169 RepID=UPI00203DB08F|nr:N-acetylmuramoyl-L-alanine amidase [Fictibacillus nanhaiensis]MCM3730085.1 N-acetylmuramoyl-L-alanine amidase [Fictibacillus nanhaiensis]
MGREMYLKVNPYTNPDIVITEVRGVVWHYTASPGATAENIAKYFNGTCIVNKRYASAHDVIDAKEVINMIKYNRIAYHAHDRNRQRLDRRRYGSNANFTTLGVELCIDKNGKLQKETYALAVLHGAFLMKKFNLDPIEHNFMHFQITGKNCPAFWVSDPIGFEKFKQDIASAMKQSDKVVEPIKKPTTKPAIKKYTLPTGIVKLGDKGTKVKQLQTALNAVKFKLKGKVDGIFGQDTLQALKRFQSVHCNPVDGIYGTKSRAALNKLLNN